MTGFDEEDDIRLSKKERRILINQYTILEKLTEKADPDDSKYYGKLISILTHGYELNYYELYQWIADPVSEETCREIVDILVMFDGLTDSYNALEDKSGIDEWRVTFVGFDGNTEAVYENYVRFMVEQEDRFSYLVKPNQYNSHAPRLERYREMLTRYHALGSPRHPNRMSKETILRIIGDSEEEE